MNAPLYVESSKSHSFSYVSQSCDRLSQIFDRSLKDLSSLWERFLDWVWAKPKGHKESKITLYNVLSRAAEKAGSSTPPSDMEPWRQDAQRLNQRLITPAVVALRTPFGGCFLPQLLAMEGASTQPGYASKAVTMTAAYAPLAIAERLRETPLPTEFRVACAIAVANPRVQAWVQSFPLVQEAGEFVDEKVKAANDFAVEKVSRVYAKGILHATPWVAPNPAVAVPNWVPPRLQEAAANIATDAAAAVASESAKLIAQPAAEMTVSSAAKAVGLYVAFRSMPTEQSEMADKLLLAGSAALLITGGGDSTDEFAARMAGVAVLLKTESPMLGTLTVVGAKTGMFLYGIWSNCRQEEIVEDPRIEELPDDNDKPEALSGGLPPPTLTDMFRSVIGW